VMKRRLPLLFPPDPHAFLQQADHRFARFWPWALECEPVADDSERRILFGRYMATCRVPKRRGMICGTWLWRRRRERTRLSLGISDTWRMCAHGVQSIP
jgi:hypothetical protein